MTAPWWEDAACLGHDPEMWSGEARNNVERDDLILALAICRACPARAECLADALTHREAHTIRGGYTATERAVMRPRAARTAQ